MSQVSRGKFGLFDPTSHFDLELTEGGSEGGVRRSMVGENGGEAGAEQAIVTASEEECVAQAAFGDLVSTSPGGASNKAVQSKTPQVVGDGARRSKTSSKWFQSLSDIAVREAVG